MKKIKIGGVIACALVCSLCMSQVTYVNAAETTNSAIIRVSSDVRLQDDFYSAVNKNWLNTTKIDDGESSKTTFDEVQEIVNEQEKNIIKDLLNNEKSYSENSDEKKIINLYKNSLNNGQRNKQEIEPIKKELDDIKNVKNLDELTSLYTKSQMSDPLIWFDCKADKRDSSKNVLYILTPMLSLGYSDQYVNPTEHTNRTKSIIQNYYIKMLKLTGYTEDEARKKVDDLFKFENMIAPSMISQQQYSTDNNIENKTYHVYTLDELNTLAPNINLKKIMNQLKIDNANKIILEQPKWLKALNDVYNEQNLQLIKNYLEIKRIENAAEFLGDDFQKALSECSNEITGATGNQSKEDKAIELIFLNLQSPFSKIYVNKYFSDKTKNDVQEIVDELRKAYEKRINNLDWMSDETKKNAINKLDKLKIQIGYIDKWDDYSSLRIRSYEEGGSLCENIADMYNLKKQKEFSKLNQNVEDEEASSMEPLTVEAWYMPNSNTISIPAAVLQGEIYNINWSKEKKMGTLGTLIGHEISHAFDNGGAQYDADGNLKNWWTQEDLKKFEDKTNRIKSFYSQIKLDNGKYINGDITVGENIADIGGVAVALDVLGEIKNPNYKEFFEGYAGCWHEIMTEEAEESSLKCNPHSPRKVRINAVLGQFDKIYETYGIKEGDKMYVKPEDRLKIW